MKFLTISKKTIFMLCALLFSVIAWGQTRTGLNGAGTSESPWQIGSADDWNEFADNPYYWGGYVKLTQNITVTKIVGFENDTESFYGDFDGDNKTLTFTYTGNYGSPFYSTYNANIHNLNVSGNINASNGFSSGLIYKNYDETTVSYVTVSVNITDGNNGSAGNNCAGFLVENVASDNDKGLLNFLNCVYNGKIIAGTNSGGFCATMYNGTATFNKCLFVPADGSRITNGNNFGQVNSASDITDCYYTMKVGTSTQGVLAYSGDLPDDKIVITNTVNDITVFRPVNVAVTGVNHTYTAGTDHYVEIVGDNGHAPSYSVTFDNNIPTYETDYTVCVKKGNDVVTTVSDKGDYALVITGAGNYTGSFKKEFFVIGDIALQDPNEAYNATTNPYVITCTADWIKLSQNVNNGTGNDLSYKLTANISVSDMVGTPSHPFKGTFNGRIGDTYGAYTLTFNYGTAENPTEDVIVAPFRYTNGATIQSLILRGAIHTIAGKEAGLIGVNTSTNSNYTTVSYVINYMDFHCYEELWDAEGGGYAYDGSDVRFSYSSYEGLISASNYHGGFCGKANGGTKFERCLFDPESGGIYWAENFVYDAQGATINYNGPTSAEDGCYYTLGNNQEESEQGTRVYVNDIPSGSIGHKITNFHEKHIYKPVEVVISGANKRYIYNAGNELLNISSVGVTFNGENAITNNWCSKVITNSSLVVVESVCALGTYTLTITAPKAGVESDYKGTVTMLIRVVESSSAGWTGLQNQLSGSDKTITLPGDITAGEVDPCLVVESGTVTINLNNHTINRNFNINDASDAVVGGHVLKVLSGATVIINGPGTIRGGYNKASSNVEHAENSDGGGIFNMGNLTLNNVTIEYNKCEKYSTGVARTARGGGIYSGNGSTLIINYCTITHNEAKGGGGGVYAEKAAVFMMDHTTVQSNQSQDKGGGVRVDATNTQYIVAEGKGYATGALLKDCNISSNTVVFHDKQSASNGGGIHLDAGTLNLTNCIINNNNASKYGGGIYMMGGTINANSCSILYNKSYDSKDIFAGYGGGVCVFNGTYNMDGGTIYENSSYKEDGGGIFVASGKTLNISGKVNITSNWTDDESLSSHHTSNVYLVGSNDKIHITGSIVGSTIGVSKKGTTGRFTDGLSGNGTTNDFISDNTDYEILPDSGEAKIGAATPVTPPTTETWNITDAVILTSTVSSDVKYITFGENGRLYVNTGGSIGSGTQITNTDPNKLIIKGGQVYTTISGVYATMLKDINYASTSGEYPDNWYLISSGIATPNILDNTNLVVVNGNNYPLYDLYRFNEAVDLQWENYRANHGDFTLLQNGRGYLYRNYNDYTISMQGTLNAAGFDYLLSYSGTNELKGFHILGNPYSHDIYKGSAESAIPNGSLLNSKYYVLNPSGSKWDLTNDGTAIPPMTGILVQAIEQIGEDPNYTLTIANSTAGYVAPAKGSSDNNNIWFTINNNKYEDKACVEFRKGHGLNKISHLNEEAPMLYVHHGDEDFASVDMNPETKAFDLNFEAKTMGLYTLSVKPQGEFSYLHLYDKVAGRDIDLLNDEEYTFIGSPMDRKDRFEVRLEYSDGSESSESIFAYQNGNDILVSGEGELQMFDVTGRLVAQQRINGVEMVAKPSTTGVYIFRLNEKTQKMVVR